MAVGRNGRTKGIDLPDHSPPRLTQAVLFLAMAETGRRGCLFWQNFGRIVAFCSGRRPSSRFGHSASKVPDFICNVISNELEKKISLNFLLNFIWDSVIDYSLPDKNTKKFLKNIKGFLNVVVNIWRYGIFGQFIWLWNTFYI